MAHQVQTVPHDPDDISPAARQPHSVTFAIYSITFGRLLCYFFTMLYYFTFELYYFFALPGYDFIEVGYYFPPPDHRPEVLSLHKLRRSEPICLAVGNHIRRTRAQVLDIAGQEQRMGDRSSDHRAKGVVEDVTNGTKVPGTIVPTLSVLSV